MLIIKEECDEYFIANLTECPRCGLGHIDLEFKTLDEPITKNCDEPFTHWAICPEKNEPLLKYYVNIRWLAC